MAASVLVLKRTSPVQVYTMVGTTLTQLGDDLPASSETGSDAGDVHVNRVISAFGGVYACVDDGVYKLQVGGTTDGEWSNLAIDGGLPYTGQDTTETKWQYGPYFKVIDNEPYIFGVYNATTVNSIRTWKLNLLTGASSISGDLSRLIDGDEVVGAQIMYNGSLHIWVRDGSTHRHFTVNPDTTPPTASSMINAAISPSLMAGHEVAFDIFNGKLLATARFVTDSFPYIFQFDAGTWIPLFSITSVFVANSTSRRRALFNDGTTGYAIVPGSGNLWHMWQINSTAGVLSVGSELTTTVLPPAIQALSTGFWAVYQNQLSDGTSEILLNFTNTSGIVTQYKFVDSSTQLTLLDSSTLSTSLVMSPEGGGARALIESGPTVTVYAKERVSGGEKVTFRCSGGQTSQVVRFFFGTDHEVPITQAQLTGTVTGGSATRNGNQVEDVDADGTTDYTVTVQALGFEDLDRIELTARISAS